MTEISFRPWIVPGPPGRLTRYAEEDMKAEDAWWIGEVGFDWCGACRHKVGMGEKQCGHPRPAILPFRAVSGERLEQCLCHDRKDRSVAKPEPQGSQRGLFDA